MTNPHQCSGRLRITAAAAVLGALTVGGCNGDDPVAPQDYDPDIPTEWAPAVTNPFFPLAPGSHRVYESDDGVEVIVIDVLAAPRDVNGVSATVVRDQVFEDGELIEDTFDWFAQDVAGNVWYLGEDSREIEDGQVVSTAGSWEWGVDGALPGIYMWADPGGHIGEEYRQEYAAGVAEDWGEVLAVDVDVSVPAGDFSGCVQTEDWNALDSGPRENKFYCSGIGPALELEPGGTRVELVEVDNG
ncbi:MAG: hypothetical protein R3195_08010 [Gemmatimonadota bacterium]|nr:hypothetical protein [Gemmatimonadota bacterium]